MSLRSSIGQACADAWLATLFWHTRHAPWVAAALRPAIIRGAWALSPGMRAATLANAAHLLGASSSRSERKRLALGVVGNFLDAVIEFGGNRALTSEELSARLGSVEGEAAYVQARAAGRGAILATAHLGSFETAMALLTQREPKIHVVFHPDRSPLFERLREQQHARLGIRDARVTEGLPMWLRLRDALRSNEVVLMQADRVMPGQPGVAVPFFDCAARFPTGPVKLARLTGAPIVPVFSLRRDDGRIDIIIDEPLWPERTPAAPPGRTDPLLLGLVRVLESRIAAHPEQWLCLHEVWAGSSVTDAADVAESAPRPIAAVTA